jgi:cobalt transporter subunit CbtB
MKRQPGDLPSRKTEPKLPVGRRGGFMNMHSGVLGAGTLSTPRAEALKAALIAAVLGIGLVFLTGFAHILVLHNGTHDTRHALSFPCH